MFGVDYATPALVWRDDNDNEVWVTKAKSGVQLYFAHSAKSFAGFWLKFASASALARVVSEGRKATAPRVSARPGRSGGNSSLRQEMGWVGVFFEDTVRINGRKVSAYVWRSPAWAGDAEVGQVWVLNATQSGIPTKRTQPVMVLLVYRGVPFIALKFKTLSEFIKARN